MKIKILLNFINIILFIKSIYSSLDYCYNTSFPILLSSTNTCVMQYCEEEEFSNNICIKDNHIIKAQWLNNIREFGEENCRLTKILKYSNEDLLAFCAIEPMESYSPYFYGIKNNGRPLFIEDERETSYKTFEGYSIFPPINYYEGEVILVKTEEDGKEYPIYFGKGDKYTELYDVEDEFIFCRFTYVLFTNKMLLNIRGSAFNLKESNNFLYAGIFFPYDTGFDFIMPETYKKYLYLYKIYLYKKDYLYQETDLIIKNSEKIEVEGNMISCFQLESKYIVCFYIQSINEKKYKIIIYEENDLTKNIEKLYLC